MDNVRYNISPCSAEEVQRFVSKMDPSVYVPNGTVRADEKSHYDRYSFLAEDNRIAVVYDTSANILSITGRADFAQSLLDLFAPQAKSVKRSTVPAQGSVPAQKRESAVTEMSGARRAKLFVSPDRIKRRSEFAPAPTIFVSSRGAEMLTDEIFPPQRVKRKYDQAQPEPKKRPLPSYGESSFGSSVGATGVEFRYSHTVPSQPERVQTEHGSDNSRPVGIAISTGISRTGDGTPRRATISFGTEEDERSSKSDIRINTRPVQSEPSQQPAKRKRGRPPKIQKAANDTVAAPENRQQQQLQQQQQQVQQAHQSQQPQAQQQQQQPAKRKRGRPPKNQKPTGETAIQPDNRQSQQPQQTAVPEYKNGYSVKNFPSEALDNALSRLRSYGKKVADGEVEFKGTISEVKSYTVTDSDGQKVVLRYATNRKTLQLQGKRSNLFGEVMSQVSGYSDYSSALENYVEENGGGKKKVSDVQNKLKKRLPTAYEYLSEQSRIDFSYGIHDFGQNDLRLSDYSVLLVPAFRGLERFVFDLQSAEGIHVKMIGQAFDKDDSGKYILKSGYTKRIGSVIYAEVLVALYTEYFSQRNFFAHSDNTDNNISRSIPERAAAQKIFEHLLNVVEYNAKKLKEIGFSVK